ncbi:fimbrial protein [Burkholderia sp. 4701]|nr:fimbrial protein [Burkholderia sp. 4701]MXN81109.1 fimbrial protein [Burkholderia sp. 4812]
MTTILRRVCRWRQAPARLFGAAACAACMLYADAATAGATAVDCTFSNIHGSPWRQVTKLTGSTPIGAVLQQRTVSLIVSYKFGPVLSGQFELVGAGHWKPGTFVSDGVARTNVDGIGLRWSGGKEGDRRTLPQAFVPIAVETKPITSGASGGDSAMFYFIQELVLTKSPSGLPTGDLYVKDLLGTPAIALYAYTLPKGIASIGSAVTVPEDLTPANLCKQSISYPGVLALTIGNGGGIVVPQQCEVVSNMIVPVDLGHVPLSQFASLHAMSKPVDFNITLSQCAAAAKPAISFRDKAVRPNADKTLLELSASGGKALARGFNIVMTNSLTGERIAYDEPDRAKQYPMKRVGDDAVMPLSARYIRTGADAELKAGYAGGAAEFTFTFP